VSDIELEDVPIRNWFDSESDLPEIIFISLSTNLGINVGKFSVPTQDSLATGVEDDSLADLGLSKGNQIGDVLSEKKRSDTRDDLQPIPILTTPHSKSPPHFLCHRTWLGYG